MVGCREEIEGGQSGQGNEGQRRQVSEGLTPSFGWRLGKEEREERQKITNSEHLKGLCEEQGAPKPSSSRM